MPLTGAINSGLARGLELSKGLAALDLLADVGETDGDHLTEPSLEVVGQADVDLIPLPLGPEVVIREFESPGHELSSAPVLRALVPVSQASFKRGDSAPRPHRAKPDGAHSPARIDDEFSTQWYLDPAGKARRDEEAGRPVRAPRTFLDLTPPPHIP
jgi:hypothetical protein